ncbi:hypothetical protein [Chryseobacterium sp. T1]
MKRHEITKLLTKSQRVEFGREIMDAIGSVNEREDIESKREYRSLMTKANNEVNKKYERLALANQ